MDRVWALDTGRPIVNGTTLLAAVPGGPKLVGFDQNGTSFTTITFPPNVVAADSSLNDVRFDLRGGGFAYITDSSPQRPGIVIVDLASGASWRHLDGHPSVSFVPGFVPVYDGGEQLSPSEPVSLRRFAISSALCAPAYNSECRYLFYPGDVFQGPIFSAVLLMGSQSPPVCR
jgi:hypothetical protein